MTSCAHLQGCLSGVSAPVQGETSLRLQAEIAGATQQADQARKSLVDWLADAVASKLSLAASTQRLHTAGGAAVATAGNRQADELADENQVAAYLMILCRQHLGPSVALKIPGLLFLKATAVGPEPS